MSASADYRRYQRRRIAAWCGARCFWCQQELGDRDMTLDHVVPKSMGGPMTITNLVICCRACNEHRGNMPFDKYVRWHAHRRAK